MPDLFDLPAALAGFTYAEEAIGRDEEQALISGIEGAGLAPFRFHKWTGKRMTASFGWQYDFSSGSFAPAAPLPGFVLAARARAARFAGLEEADLVQVLLTRYDKGAGIGWHRDRPVFGHVIGLSLGAPTTLRFRLRKPHGHFVRVSQTLDPRSIYHLDGDARHVWEHSIAPVDSTRWSVTFRSLSGRGKAVAARSDHCLPRRPSTSSSAL
jgi:DNA oxidative demethylase